MPKAVLDALSESVKTNLSNRVIVGSFRIGIYSEAKSAFRRFVLRDRNGHDTSSNDEGSVLYQNNENTLKRHGSALETQKPKKPALDREVIDCSGFD